MRKYVLAIVGLVLLCLLAALGTASGSPDTITVDSTTDVLDTAVPCNLVGIGDLPGPDKQISLREAICAANNNAGSDTIAFSIPVTDTGYQVSGITGTWTISLASLLPILTGGGTIISGTTQATNILSDTNPYGPEIEITGAGVGSGNCLHVASASNVIHGLVINRCPSDGIAIIGTSATTNTVSGNYIGTDASGSTKLGNGMIGVEIRDGPQGNVVGGDTPEERNVISGNNIGLTISGNGTMSNTVSGNYIGIDASGSSDLRNLFMGVQISSGAQNNTVGGRTEGERNVISKNRAGVSIVGSGTMSNTVSGNYIGTDATGTQELGNRYGGVRIEDGAQNNTIGGQTAGERNVISGNSWSGVYIKGADTDGNTVSQNYIGTDVTGTQDKGNSYDGVRIDTGAQNNTIGPGNLIFRNDLAGVRIDGSFTISNTITENSIYDNVSEGIDNYLGGNTELPPPAVSAANACFVLGTAGAGDTVEVFTGPDEEGKTYLTTVSADGGGNWSTLGSFTLDTYVTATATDDAGNTSEFSTAVGSGTCHQIFVPLTMKKY